jgi:hypothetical protein
MDTTQIPSARELHPAHRQVAETAAKDAEIASLRESLKGLRDFMNSSKFRSNADPAQWSATDTMVQAGDIIGIVDQALRNADEASNEGWRQGVAAALTRRDEIAAGAQAKREQRLMAAGSY